MQCQSIRKRAAALHGVGDFDDCIFQNLVTLLFCQNVEASQQWQTCFNQRRQLPSKDHQDFWLNRSALEKNNALFRARRGRRAPRRRSTTPSFLAVGTAGGLLNNARGEIAGLAQLSDGGVGRRGFNQAGRLLPAGVKSYVVKTWHADVV